MGYNTIMSERIYKIKFSGVYPLYIAKIESNGRSKEELDQVLGWLTGYDDAGLEAATQGDVTLEQFFTGAPKLNPARKLITGVICGIRVEDIKDPLTQEIRYMDKLINELAKGKPMEKILRAA